MAQIINSIFAGGGNLKFNLTESHKGSSDATAQITFDPKKVLAISGCQSVWE